MNLLSNAGELTPLQLVERLVDDASRGSIVSDSATRTLAEQVMSASHDTPKWAILAQPLAKLFAPTVSAMDPRDRSWPAAYRPRGMCRDILVPLNGRFGRPVATDSADPYANSVIRFEVLGSDDWRSARRAPHLAAWEPALELLSTIDRASEPAARALEVLTAALAALASQAMSAVDVIENVMATQTELRASPRDPNALEQRRDLINRGERVLDELMARTEVGLSVQGSVGKGLPAEIPWLRLFDPSHAPSPTSGIYLVFLFDAAGEATYLTLCLGTEASTPAAIDSEVMRLRDILSLDEAMVTGIDLQSAQEGGRPASYERGTIASLKYSRGAVDEDFLLEGLGAMVALLREAQAIKAADPEGAVQALTVDLVRAESSARGLRLPVGVIEDAVAALRAGKHLLLTGPPGTGKTTFAEVLASAASKAGLCGGSLTATATGSWSSYDVVGGYTQTQTGALRFGAGLALQAIDSNRWMIIDELNRADVDKALGALFTVLSGQPVTLPFEEVDSTGTAFPPSIVPAGVEPPSGTVVHTVSPSWRLIATMNDWDQDRLFELSFALLRRFAVIRVGVPSIETIEEIIEADAPGEGQLSAGLTALIRMPAPRLGPAILRSTARFLRERSAIAADDEDPEDLLLAALRAEVLPQLGHLDGVELGRVTQYLTETYTPELPTGRLRAMIEEQVGYPVELPRNVKSEAVDELES